MMAQHGQMSVLDSLLQSLNKATEHNRDDQSPPAVVLWTDKECQWQQAVPILRGSISYVYGFAIRWNDCGGYGFTLRRVRLESRRRSTRCIGRRKILNSEER